jgi:hypothetical protein
MFELLVLSALDLGDKRDKSLNVRHSLHSTTT